MPKEIISLLSSSPPGPSPPVRPTSPTLSPRTRQGAPSMASNYDIPASTIASSSKAPKRPPGNIPNQPIASTNAANSKHSRQDNDFLFLSDDSDIAGNSDGNPAKKARTSTSTAQPRKRDGNGLKKTKSAVIPSKSRRHLSPVPLKRWNSTLDPIEHSSSPNTFPTYGNPTNADISSDPFRSPLKTAGTNSKPSPIDVSSDPFRSSPIRDADGYRPPPDTRAKRPLSNDIIGSPRGKRPSKTTIVIDLSADELESPKENRPPKRSRQNGAWDPISSSMPETGTNRSDQADSDSDLPDLGDIDFSRRKSRRYSLSLTPSPRRKKPKTAPKSTAIEKRAEPKKTDEERNLEKKKKAEAREAEKERKRIEKERAKEQRAIEKQKEKALAEVNKLKTNKKVAVPEMIVDLSNTLSVGVKTQIEKLLGSMDVQFEYWHSPVDNVVKWRRKVGSKYNEELGHWEPIPMCIKPEQHVMAIVEAAEFVKLVLGPEGQDLEAHVLRMKTAFPDSTFIYLIEGLAPWMRKNKNILNRRFASAVRALDTGNNNDGGGPAPSSSQSQPRRRNNNTTTQQEYIDEDIIEDALLSLQIVHGALIHHTNVQVETAEWAALFTQHISTIPYRRARDAGADAGFCMEAGQVRTGDDAGDTYVRMLQEVARVTAPVAHGVAARYASVGALVRGLERDGPLALENCRKGANRDGAFSDRVVGPAVSRRMYKIFTSRDPGSMDV